MVTPQGTRNPMEQCMQAPSCYSKANLLSNMLIIFSFQNGSLGDKAVIKKRHCRTVVELPF